MADLTPADARKLATELLESLPQRCVHDLAVGENCDRVAERMGVRRSTRAIAVVAAYLHDIGYAPALKRTGFHPIDGGTYLRERGIGPISEYVAHHSQAYLQAELLGLSLDSFKKHVGLIQDLVDYADMRTDADGRVVTLEQRLDGILSRYQPTDSVAAVVPRRRPILTALSRRIERRCGGDPLA